MGTDRESRELAEEHTEITHFIFVVLFKLVIYTVIIFVSAFLKIICCMHEHAVTQTVYLYVYSNFFLVSIFIGRRG